jgi:two-component system, OmpR family, response regulator
MTSGIRVLVVDDETVFSDSLTKVLTRRGMRVASAPDGQRALKLMAEQRFDVIVLDVRMAGMGGLATLRAVRERDGQIPVLILTGHMDLNEVSEAMKGGVTEVLFKPCPVVNLVSSIQNAYTSKVSATEVSGCPE